MNHFFKCIDFAVPDFIPHGTRGTAATLLREHGFGRDVVELLLAQSEKNATVAAYSPMELAADRKRALQNLADRVEALAAGSNVIPLHAAGSDLLNLSSIRHGAGVLLRSGWVRCPLRSA